jgi:hypothetical protein
MQLSIRCKTFGGSGRSCFSTWSFASSALSLSLVVVGSMGFDCCCWVVVAGGVADASVLVLYNVRRIRSEGTGSEGNSRMNCCRISITSRYIVRSIRSEGTGSEGNSRMNRCRIPEDASVSFV